MFYKNYEARSYEMMETEEDLQEKIEDATQFEVVELSDKLAEKLKLVCEKCGQKIDQKSGNRVLIYPHGRVHTARIEVYCMPCNFKSLLRFCDKEKIVVR